MRVSKAGIAFQPIHLVLFEEEFDAAGQPLDRFPALAVHGFQIELWLNLDAHFRHRAIGRRVKNDTERLEKLFQLYTQMTATTPASAATGKGSSAKPKPARKTTRSKPV